jgi:TolB-like protein
LTLGFVLPSFDLAMSSAGETEHPPLPPSIFLSYPSEDRDAARSIRDALSAAGLEVWYDENELGGGDAWDQKIRRQIRECDYFMPIVSAQSEARHEGYFRREWRLAVERALDMADDHTFLLPVVIDNTDQARARVPERFLTVQWLKVPNGQPTPGLAALSRRLLSGKPADPPPVRRTPRAKVGIPPPVAREMPPFPIEEPGQRVKFWVEATGWAIKSAWIFIQRQPRTLRIIFYLWLAYLVLFSGRSHKPGSDGNLTPGEAQKLRVIADQFKGSANKEDIGKLGADIAREFAGKLGAVGLGSPLLAVPFSAPADDPAAAKLANTTFVLLYGRLSISHQGQVGLAKDSLASLEAGRAASLGRDSHANFVLAGGIEGQGTAKVLTVEIVEVTGATVLWSKGYPVDRSDPEAIAPEVEAKVPSLDDN